MTDDEIYAAQIKILLNACFTEDQADAIVTAIYLALNAAEDTNW